MIRSSHVCMLKKHMGPAGWALLSSTPGKTSSLTLHRKPLAPDSNGGTERIATSSPCTRTCVIDAFVTTISVFLCWALQESSSLVWSIQKFAEEFRIAVWIQVQHDLLNPTAAGKVHRAEAANLCRVQQRQMFTCYGQWNLFRQILRKLILWRFIFTHLVLSCNGRWCYIPIVSIGITHIKR